MNDYLIKNNNIENKPQNLNKTKKLKNNFLSNHIKRNKSTDKNNINIKNKKQEKKVKIKSNKTKFKSQNVSSYNRNINDYIQFLTEYTNTPNGNLSWATKLRENSNIINNRSPKKEHFRKIRNINSAKEKAKVSKKGISLTNNFKEPKFYADDLEKYKLKIKKQKRPLSSILNPNFNNIRHLFINKNAERFREFSSCLRNYNFTPNQPGKEKIKWNKYVGGNKENKNLSKFLLPRTHEGKEILKKLEKRMYRPYHILYKKIILGNDTIKQKYMRKKNDYTYSGIGEYLNMIKYHSHYGVMNSSQAENILKNETNSVSLFELGLRNYKSFDAKKNKFK